MLIEEHNKNFELSRYAFKTRFKGKSMLLLKPSTLMNLSGKAVKFGYSKGENQLAQAADY